MRYFLIACLVFTAADSRAGTYRIYNTIDENTSCYIAVTGEETGRTARSPKMTKFQEAWKVNLNGGRYRIKIYGKNWSRDLGWTDLGRHEEATVYLGWNDSAWRRVREESPDGSTRMVWRRYVAAPTDRKLIASTEPEPVEADQRDFEVAKPIDKRHRFGIFVRKCPDGIHIESVTENCPATRCIDSEGTELSLEAGDHILEVNGESPSSVEEFLQMIEESPQGMAFVVKDKNGGVVRKLSAQLEY